MDLCLILIQAYRKAVKIELGAPVLAFKVVVIVGMIITFIRMD